MRQREFEPSIVPVIPFSQDIVIISMDLLEYFRLLIHGLSISSMEFGLSSLKLIMFCFHSLFPVRILHFLHTMCARVWGLKRPDYDIDNTYDPTLFTDAFSSKPIQEIFLKHSLRSNSMI